MRYLHFETNNLIGFHLSICVKQNIMLAFEMKLSVEIYVGASVFLFLLYFAVRKAFDYS